MMTTMLAAETWHGPSVDSIAFTRDPSGWGSDPIDWIAMRLQCGLEALEAATVAEVLCIDAVSSTAMIRLPDGRERYIDASPDLQL